MSLCVFSQFGKVIVKHHTKVYLPAVTAGALVYLTILLTGSVNVSSGGTLELPKTNSLCGNSSNELVINLGYVHLPARHCIVYCLQSGQFGVFDCFDRTKVSLQSVCVRQLCIAFLLQVWSEPGISKLDRSDLQVYEINCDLFTYKELCRIPMVVGALLPPGWFTCFSR